VALRSENPPILVCADFQAQYLDDECVAGPEITRCLALLALWRAELWPVLHLKRIAQTAWFDPASNLTDWNPAFRPRPGEMVFEHPLPSAYSSSRFAEFMASMRGVHCLMAGCSLDETILATVVEGFHRSHRFAVVGDAVLCGLSETGDPVRYRVAMTRAIGKFADIRQSSSLIDAAAGATLRL
jgi:nicotinamidase-related amidase